MLKYVQWIYEIQIEIHNNHYSVKYVFFTGLKLIKIYIYIYKKHTVLIVWNFTCLVCNNSRDSLNSLFQIDSAIPKFINSSFKQQNCGPFKI